MTWYITILSIQTLQKQSTKDTDMTEDDNKQNHSIAPESSIPDSDTNTSSNPSSSEDNLSDIPQPTMPPSETSSSDFPPPDPNERVSLPTNNDTKNKTNLIDKIKSAPKKTKLIAGGGIAGIIILVFILLFATHVICFHDWQEATCYKPKTCAICGDTEGSPLGHTVEEWTTDVEPTCSQPGEEHGSCIRCGLEISRSIDTTAHTPGEWKVTKDYSISSYGAVIPGTQTQYCSVCGAEMDTKEYTTELTLSQTNALRQAANYLDYMSFSYSGLIDQLEYEGYSTEDATFAVDHCGADWNEQAALKAQDYLDFMSFSRSGLIDQLMYEGFSREQAEYGVSAVGY